MLPFIILAVSAVAGVTGAYKAVEAKEKYDEAERIVKRAERKFEEEKEKAEKFFQNFVSKVEEIGNLRLEIYKNDFEILRGIGKKLGKNIKSRKEFEDTYSIFEELIEKVEVDKGNIKTLEKNLDLELGEAAGKSALAGVLAYAGAIGLAETVGVASTGTALSSLSGAAFTNAMLAWFGGGSLAAGGLGIVGGTAVLGGIVAGPAIAIFGFTLNKLAEEKLTEAEEFEAEVEEHIVKLKDVREKARLNIEIAKENIKETIEIRKRYLERLEILKKEVEKLASIRKSKKYQRFLKEEVMPEFTKTILLAKTLSQIISEPLKDKFISFEEV